MGDLAGKDGGIGKGCSSGALLLSFVQRSVRARAGLHLRHQMDRMGVAGRCLRLHSDRSRRRQPQSSGHPAGLLSGLLLLSCRQRGLGAANALLHVWSRQPRRPPPAYRTGGHSVSGRTRLRAVRRRAGRLHVRPGRETAHHDPPGKLFPPLQNFQHSKHCRKELL